MNTIETVPTQSKSGIKRLILRIVLILLALYVISGIVLAIQFVQMGKQDEVANDVSLGQARIDELNDQGIQVTHALYSDAEIAEVPSKAAAKLHYFPNPQNQKSKFVLICPGGGFFSCALDSEGYPAAAQLNELGYTAFVLEYRNGENGGDFAALDDLACAVQYVMDRADEFNVETDAYALLGCSAGGDLVGLFGTETMGYANYDVQKPSVIFLGYPWCNQNIMSINPAKMTMYAVINHLGYEGLIGKGATEQEKQRMRVPWQVTDAYPPCYIMHGTSDIIVPIKTHSDVLVSAFEENGVQHVYERADGVCHACGIAKGTSAENWISRAIAFWEDEVLS